MTSYNIIDICNDITIGKIAVLCIVQGLCTENLTSIVEIRRFNNGPDNKGSYSRKAHQRS